MPVFKFRALDSNNEIFEHMLNATSYYEAKQAIAEKGFTPIKIEESKGIKNFNVELFPRIKTQDIVTFCRELSLIIKSGINLALGLNILMKQSQKSLKSAIYQISVEVQKGRTLAQAMKETEYKFPDLLIKMISSGEASGNIDEVLNNMADYYEREGYIRQKLKGALVYPVILIVVATALIAFFAQMILPTIEDLLAGHELPLITQIVMGVTHFIGSKYSLIIMFVVIIGLVIAKKLVPNKLYSKVRDRILLNIPVVGSVIKDLVTVRFVRTLYLLYKSGINIVSVLGMLKKIISNSIAEEAIEHALDGVKRGEKLGAMLSTTDFFDPLVIQMISVGEETGEIEQILAEISAFYERRLEMKIERLVGMLEPVFTLVIGGAIAIIIVAMALPMFNMVGNMNPMGGMSLE